MAKITYSVGTTKLPVTVQLLNLSNTVLKTATHNAAGNYEFTAVNNGSYKVKATDAASCVATTGTITVDCPNDTQV